MGMQDQKPVFIVGSVILGITFVILGAYLMIARAPETDLDVTVFDKIIIRDSSDDDASADRLMTAGKYGAAGDKNLWKMNGDFFTIEIPHEWEISQRDSGGASMITFFNPEEDEYKADIYIRSGSIYESGERFIFDDWLQVELGLIGDYEACNQKTIGGLTMACYTGEIDDQEYIVYFAELNPELYTYVRKPIEENETTPLWSTVNSINFDPSDQAVEEAYIIP